VTLAVLEIHAGRSDVVRPDAVTAIVAVGAELPTRAGVGRAADRSGALGLARAGRTRRRAGGRRRGASPAPGHAGLRHLGRGVEPLGPDALATVVLSIPGHVC